MTVHHVEGNLFDHPQALKVVTVNCVGASGAGIHKESAHRYPDVDRLYKAHCRAGLWLPGKAKIYTSETTNTCLLYVSTKDDWRNPSQLAWIVSILKAMRRAANDAALDGDRMIYAMPLIGCGHGGLHGPTVLELIHEAFDETPCEAYLYLPR